jgi:hypothetical protein
LSQKVVTIGQTLKPKTRKTGKFERMVQRYEKRPRIDEFWSYDEDDGESRHP